jgi:hypothetical protein
VLEPVIARYRGTVKRLYFRGDAAFANPEIYEFLEAEGLGYTIRLPANRVVQDKIGYLLKRPVGRPPHEVRRYFASFSYQVVSKQFTYASLYRYSPGRGHRATAQPQRLFAKPRTLYPASAECRPSRVSAFRVGPSLARKPNFPSLKGWSFRRSPAS